MPVLSCRSTIGDFLYARIEDVALGQVGRGGTGGEDEEKQDASDRLFYRSERLRKFFHRFVGKLPACSFFLNRLLFYSKKTIQFLYAQIISCILMHATNFLINVYYFCIYLLRVPFCIFVFIDLIIPSLVVLNDY